LLEGKEVDTDDGKHEGITDGIEVGTEDGPATG
jgi:hypothetical protein